MLYYKSMNKNKNNNHLFKNKSSAYLFLTNVANSFDKNIVFELIK